MARAASLSPLRKLIQDSIASLVLAAVVLALSLGLTYGLWRSAQADADESLKAEFDFRVREVSERIKQRILSYEYLLRSTQAFFTGSDEVTRSEFKEYVASLDLEKTFPGATGIGIATVVPNGRKAQHVTEVRHNFPDYRIFPEGERTFYAPVVFREPLSETGKNFVGFDMYSESSRRAAMEKSRDYGMHAISGKLSLLMRKEPERFVGFIMFYPLYKDGKSSSPEERREHIAGWVYAPVHMAELMAGLLGERASELDIEIFDGETESEASLMFDTDESPLGVHSDGPRLKAMERLDVGAHTWTLAVHSLPAFEARLNQNKPIYIAVAGSMVSLLLALLTFLMSSGRMRALAAASRMNRDLRKSEERYARVIEGSDQGFWEWNLSTQEYRISPHFEAMLGYARGEMSGHAGQQILIPPDQWAMYVHPDDLAKAWESIDLHLQGMSPTHEVEIRCQTKSGDWKWLLTKGSIVARNREGKPLTMSGTITDISERKRVERALRLTQFSVEKATDPVFWVNQDAKIRLVNEAACRLLGYSKEDLLQLTIQDIDPEFSLDKWRGGFWPYLREKQSAKLESVHQTRDGRMIPVEITSNFIDYEGQEYSCSFVRDITERKRSEELIWRQANFDALTGLPNRRMFQERLEQEILKVQRTNHPLALMFIDLDYFKDVNDTLGHAAGDVLLQKTAERLSGCVRKTDMVARLGGDEFTILLTDMHDIASAERVARNILAELHEGFVMDNGEDAYISASIGITFCPNDATNMQDLLRNADQAMYAAKGQGGNRCIYFDPSLQQTAQFRRQMIKHLHEALDNEQFKVEYQPIVELASGRISKAEALIRWHHPTRGMINPAEFIPIAEETDMIHDIGGWVFQEVTKHTNFWRENYRPAFQVNVNVSPVQFKKDGILSSNWISQLKKLDVAAQGVVIEITEGLLLDASANVKDQLIRLRDAGIEVALDDFGTGYSSLAYLKRFDIDYIKIDKTFVSNLKANSDDHALCEAMIVMAHKLGIKVIAEGVETEEQRYLLNTAGCDYAQGYLFSQPVSSEKLGELLSADVCFPPADAESNAMPYGRA